MKVEDLGQAGAMAIWMASLSGTVELARQLEIFGISDPEDSLENARQIRPVVLAVAENIIERYGRP